MIVHNNHYNLVLSWKYKTKVSKENEKRGMFEKIATILIIIQKFIFNYKIIKYFKESINKKMDWCYWVKNEWKIKWFPYTQIIG